MRNISGTDCEVFHVQNCFLNMQMAMREMRIYKVIVRQSTWEKDQRAILAAKRSAGAAFRGESKESPAHSKDISPVFQSQSTLHQKSKR